MSTRSNFKICSVLFFLSMPVILAGGCSVDEPGGTDEFGVSWGVETNDIDAGFRSVLTIENHSRYTLDAGNWAFFFNFVYFPDPESLPESVHLTHINGDFYKIEPTEEFERLAAGESIRIPMVAAGKAIREGDAPRGVYFEIDGETIISVNRVEALPFEREEQLHRGEADQMPVVTAAVRYQKNASLRPLPAAEVSRITPTPLSVEEKTTGDFSLSSSAVIVFDREVETEARFLTERLKEQGVTSALVNGEEEEPGDETKIVLQISGDLNTGYLPDVPGSYLLEVDEKQISVKGTDTAGVFYGIQSLRSLIETSPNREGEGVTIPAVSIADAPRFQYRGFHLDVARNFQPAETVRKLLDIMAMYKMNKFHFHLTDDEGWRLPVDPLPELTEVGGRRGHTHTEAEYLVPSHGSGPDPDPGASYGSGWYSRAEYIDLLRYARDRHIEVIPEIDVPGHARAAIVAMKARYNRLSEEGDAEGAERYRLNDPDDQSVYRSIQGWNDNVINVCRESAYRFMELVIDEIIAMHNEAGIELTTIHMGADEVPQGVWEKSPDCHHLLEESEELETPRDLQNAFFNRIRGMLTDRGLKMAGWEEIALDHSGSSGERGINPAFTDDVRPHVWANVWGSGGEDHAYRLANAGYEVVMSHASNFYFDLAYEKHPAEPGFIWAGFVDHKTPYSFIPFGIYKNAVVDAMGRVIPENAYKEAVQLEASAQENILGLQGQLWSENLNRPGRAEYMALPRLIELAERAWAPRPEWARIESRPEREKVLNESWNEFANRLGRYELPRLDRHGRGTNYRIPPPGAVLEDGMLKANIIFPGLEIRFTRDGSEPGPDSEKYTGPVEVDETETILLRTFDSQGRGSRAAGLERVMTGR